MSAIHSDTTDSSRRRILKAAVSEFAEKGFDGARMESIARKADVNPALIHYHFNNKQNLYESILETLMPRSGTEILRQSVELFQLDAVEKLTLSAVFLKKLHLEIMSDEHRQIAFWALARGDIQLRQMARTHFIPLIKIISDYIREGISSGDFLPLEKPEFYAWAMVSLTLIYEGHRDLYRGSDLFDIIYSPESDIEFSEFLQTGFLEKLTGRYNTEPPSIKPEIIQYITEKLSNSGDIE